MTSFYFVISLAEVKCTKVIYWRTIHKFQEGRGVLGSCQFSMMELFWEDFVFEKFSIVYVCQGSKYIYGMDSKKVISESVSSSENVHYE